MKPLPKLTKAQKRVLIAKDVLKQIRARKYFAKPEIFAEVRNRNCIIEQSLITANNPACDVCAAGAAIVSGIRLFNDQKSDTTYIRCWQGMGMCAHFLGMRQSRLIEAAFEAGVGWTTKNEIGVRNFEACVKFYRRYPNNTDRLIAIFRNIIRNGGTFKP